LEAESKVGGRIKEGRAIAPYMSCPNLRPLCTCMQAAMLHQRVYWLPYAPPPIPLWVVVIVVVVVG